MIVPLVIFSRDELVMIWSMSEDELLEIRVALVIHWMNPFSDIVV